MSASQEELDLLTTIWFEKSRPGHTVEIVEWEQDRSYPYGRRVVIRHLTAHNKRKWEGRSSLLWKSFKSRYAPKPDQVEAMLEAKTERLRLELEDAEEVYRRKQSEFLFAFKELNAHKSAKQVAQRAHEAASDGN